MDYCIAVVFKDSVTVVETFRLIQLNVMILVVPIAHKAYFAWVIYLMIPYHSLSQCNHREASLFEVIFHSKRIIPLSFIMVQATMDSLKQEHQIVDLVCLLDCLSTCHIYYSQWRHSCCTIGTIPTWK